MAVAIIYGDLGSSGDNIQSRRQWWRSYTEVLVVIIYGGVGNGGNHIWWRRWYWRSCSEAPVLVAIIYGGGGGDHIGGGDIMQDFLGELVHIQ